MPSGASTGTREALELRDGDKTRYGGKGVRKAVGHVTDEIASALVGTSADQRALDAQLDRARRHAEFLAPRRQRRRSACRWPPRMPRRPSGACRSTNTWRRSCRPRRASRGPVLPVPMMNILNGGAHADTNVDFQEFMVMPLGLPTFSEALRAGVEIFHALRGLLKKRGLATGVGDEGGFAPSLSSNREAVELVLEAVQAAGYHAGRDVFVALDVASSEFWDDDAKSYVLKKSGEGTKSSDDMIALYEDWIAAVSDHLDRRRPGRGRLARLEAADRRARLARAAGRRRRVRDESGDPAPRHRRSTSPTRCS